jgi:hypothetical protein
MTYNGAFEIRKLKKIFIPVQFALIMFEEYRKDIDYKFLTRLKPITVFV